MQINENLSLNPVMNDLKIILDNGNTVKKKVILSRLEEIYIYLRGIKAKSEGKEFYADANGNLVEIEVRKAR